MDFFFPKHVSAALSHISYSGRGVSSKVGVGNGIFLFLLPSSPRLWTCVPGQRSGVMYAALLCCSFKICISRHTFTIEALEIFLEKQAKVNQTNPPKQNLHRILYTSQ